MRIPRDIDYAQLQFALKKFGYQTTRQTGSHIRLTTYCNGQHHITIPAHKPLKIGTLNAILNEIAHHLNITKHELVIELFNNE